MPSSLAHLSDDRLVARFRAGDENAFSEIHRRFRAGLTTLARRMLDSQQAEEIVQDAFMRGYLALRATDGAMALQSWLYAIVRNGALAGCASNGTRIAWRSRSKPRAAGPAADPAFCFAARDELRQITTEINRLPERQRTALVTHAVDGRTHAETALTMHTCVPATKALIVRARSNLQAAVRAA